jgi:lipopolysaccharide biosynthesis regulator YciM
MSDERPINDPNADDAPDGRAASTTTPRPPSSDDERTLLAVVPSSLLTEAGGESSVQEAGLAQIFARDLAVAAGAPAVEEGDALLAQLFSDGLDDDMPTRHAPERAALAGETMTAPTPLPLAPSEPLAATPLPPPLPLEPASFGVAPSSEEEEATRILGSRRFIASLDPDEDEDAPAEAAAGLAATPSAPEAPPVILEAEEIQADAPGWGSWPAPASVESPEPALASPPPLPSGPPPLPSGPPPLPSAPPPASSSPARRALRPAVPPPLPQFQGERDAAAHLVASQQRDAWSARAHWLRAEAAAIEDKAQRARTLLAASELFVMAGEEPEARDAAEQARELAPSSPLVHRQVRGLLLRDGHYEDALAALDAETRVMPTPGARCHGAWLGAEMTRLRLDDAESARRRADLARRADAADPRAHVQRFCDALGEEPSDEPTPSFGKVRVPDEEELEALRDAMAQVNVYRGLEALRRGQPAATPYEALLRGRSALDAGDLDRTLGALVALEAEGSVARGAAWLVASLAASRSDQRERTLEALGRAASGTHAGAARRELAARAMESGDAAAALAAADAGDTSFTAADRLTLAALTGGGLRETEPFLDAVLRDADLAPISVAGREAMRASADAAAARAPLGSERGQAAIDLGRALARAAGGSDDDRETNAERLRARLARYADAAPESAVGRALALELDVEAGASGRVALAVSAWRSGDEAAERDGALAGGLLAEVAGEAERARQEYGRARRASPAHEGAARAYAGLVDALEAAREVAEHAAALPRGTRAAVAESEAAMRLLARGEGAEAEPYLARAAAADPALPFAAHLGERAARARADRAASLEWLRSRRDASVDPVEQARDQVREAMLLADADRGAAAGLLAAALAARSGDAGLRELYERLSPEPPADRAAYRAALAAADPVGPDAARLALEAALEHEREGNLEAAATLAQAAERAGDADLAPLCAHRAALAGHRTAELFDELLQRAKACDDPALRLEIYEDLADLDELGRGDAASGLLWRRSILEESPRHLPTLRRVASALVSAGRDEELEPVALEIARALSGPEAVAYAALSARLRLRMGAWEDAREPVLLAYGVEPRGLWALRQGAAHARAAGRHDLAAEAGRELARRTDRPSELATLLLGASVDASLAGDLEGAERDLAEAAAALPGHVRVHLERARLFEQRGAWADAAEAYEAAAGASVVPAEQARSLHRAAVFWADRALDPARARRALELVSDLDSAYADVFERLQALYTEAGARAELAELLRRRLDGVTDPTERVEMEVLRGRALAEVGDAASAKQALAAALDQSPDHVDALASFADLCAAEHDWAGAEGAWIRLVRLASGPDPQAAIYFRLGEIYDVHLPNPDRAEVAYQEILKRRPNDVAARERLVALYRRIGDPARALGEQALLINAAEEAEEKCRRTVELAAIYEEAGDHKKAEATLLAARKSWPKDVSVLTELARFYHRTQQHPAAQVLLDRAVADARRALATGRFEGALFETVAAVAELRGRADAALVAQATVAALEGHEVSIEGGGNAAADPKLDDLIAPEVMTPALRELLHKTSAVLDAAVPFDLASVRAAPLPLQQSQLGDAIREMAAAYRLPAVAVHVTQALGPVCLPATSSPPTLVLGQGLVATPRADVREFLLHRALKVLAEGCSSFSRTAPIDLWPLVAAFLKAHSPSFSPQGVDQAKLTDYYGRITRAMPKAPDPQLGLLAADVIGTIGSRASTLNTIVNGWGERVGLLAVGDPNAALVGIAWAAGHTSGPPLAGKDRVTWVGRNAGARDLVVFSVSDAYAEARARLGLDRRAG